MLQRLDAVMSNLLERKEHIGEALKDCRRTPPRRPLAGNGPGFNINLYALAAGHAWPRYCWTATTSRASCPTASPTCCAATSRSALMIRPKTP